LKAADYPLSPQHSKRAPPNGSFQQVNKSPCRALNTHDTHP
jgi:hypothetical protein